ncbi:MAG: metallophosphoesterase [Oscillospiraceae bacterium]|nr:metallophosphoesterase [Oscillospiraceae bacterium]
MKGKFHWKRLVTAACVILLLLFCLWQNTTLTVTHYTCTKSTLPEVFDGCRIVQISDLHNASFGRSNRRLVEKIKALSPDLIVITGDIADGNRTDVDTAVNFAEQAAAIAPVYYVTGNHELWLDAKDYDALLTGLGSAGVTVLADAAVTITREEDSIALLGLREESLGGTALQHLSKETADVPFRMLLAHEPQYTAEYEASGVDLVFTGHAHGGQFRLPFVGGIYAPDQGFFPAYSEGMHALGKTDLIVSRGLGNSVIPVRLFNFPEIVCVELQKDSTASDEMEAS